MSKELKGRSANCVGMIGKRAIETVTNSENKCAEFRQARAVSKQPCSCRHSANQTLHGRGRVCGTSTCMERQFRRMWHHPLNGLSPPHESRFLQKTQVCTGTALKTRVQRIILQTFWNAASRCSVRDGSLESPCLDVEQIDFGTEPE